MSESNLLHLFLIGIIIILRHIAKFHPTKIENTTGNRMFLIVCFVCLSVFFCVFFRAVCDGPPMYIWGNSVR